jgi:hypothetical protein
METLRKKRVESDWKQVKPEEPGSAFEAGKVLAETSNVTKVYGLINDTLFQWTLYSLTITRIEE